MSTKKKKSEPSGKPFSDYDNDSGDSAKLGYLITAYLDRVMEAQFKGMDVFWNEAKTEEFRPEEISLLKEAAKGSLPAIQALIEANVESIHLPFVADRVIHTLRQYKTGRTSLADIRERVWPGFLPDKSGGRDYVSEEDLKRRIEALMAYPIDDLRKILIQIKSLKEQYYKLCDTPNGNPVIRGKEGAEIINSLIGQVRSLLGKIGFNRGFQPDTLDGLIDFMRTKKRMTKELAIEIIRATQRVNEKRLQSIRVQEKPGRPKK